MLKKALGSFRANFITGFFVLVPFAAVVWIFALLWNWINGLSNLVPSALDPRTWMLFENPIATRAVDLVVTLIVLGVLIFIIWSAGVVSRHYLGKQLFNAVAKFVSRMPVLSTVYSTLRQLLDTFSSAKGKNFRRVVWVEYPRKGLYTLAFVTGERQVSPSGEKGADKFVTIYVPTTPNPTSGFYLTIAASDVKDANLSVEDALKEIISMGIVHKQE